MTRPNAQKEIVTKDDLFAALDMLDTLGMKYWVDGGWGVDLLTGEQNREHRDLDIDFDGEYLEPLLNLLRQKGYRITTDERPVRIELHHAAAGYLDIHPLVTAPDGSAKQSDGNGGWYEFQASFFTTTRFDGRTTPCISLEGQLLFHTGYEMREKDLVDLRNLNALR